MNVSESLARCIYDCHVIHRVPMWKKTAMLMLFATGCSSLIVYGTLVETIPWGLTLIILTALMLTALLVRLITAQLMLVNHGWLPRRLPVVLGVLLACRGYERAWPKQRLSWLQEWLFWSNESHAAYYIVREYRRYYLYRFTFTWQFGDYPESNVERWPPCRLRALIETLEEVVP